jgi:CBS-domain-containing membrane protein
MSLPHLSAARGLRIFAQSAGSALAIGAMAALARLIDTPLLLVPFATSIVLVMGLPESEPAQPRALIGGHIVASMVGLSVLALAGPGLVPAAVAVGLATAAMHLTRTFHPPAGIDPLVIVTANVPLTFLLTPVAAGALLLATFAFVWHRLWRSGTWPRHSPSDRSDAE